MNPEKNLILIHGALGASAQFEPWLALLRPHFQVHVFDVDGHGSRPLRGAFTMDAFAADLGHWMQENDLTGADIFGYSMGGYIALTLAAAQPGITGRIFTFATKYAWDPETAAREVKHLDPVKMQEKVPAYAAALAARHTGMGWEAMLRSTAALMLGLGQAPVLHPDVLAQVQVPVRNGIGDRDAMVTMEETLSLYRALPQSSLVVVPQCPHPLEKLPAERLCAEIRQFFS